MIYLVGEILLCLCLAFAIGLWTGWCLRSFREKRRIANLMKMYQINMASLMEKSDRKKIKIKRQAPTK